SEDCGGGVFGRNTWKFRGSRRFGSQRVVSSNLTAPTTLLNKTHCDAPRGHRRAKTKFPPAGRTSQLRHPGPPCPIAIWVPLLCGPRIECVTNGEERGLWFVVGVEEQRPLRWAMLLRCPLPTRLRRRPRRQYLWLRRRRRGYRRHYSRLSRCLPGTRSRAWTGAPACQPGMRVGDAPCQHGRHGRFAHDDVHEVVIGLGDRRVDLSWVVGLQRVVVDVHLSDKNLQAHPAQSAHPLTQTFAVRSRPAGVNVRLDTNCVNRHLICLHPAHQFEYRDPLLYVSIAVGLDTVVVIGQQYV